MMENLDYATTGGGGAHPMQPTWTGFIHTTHDALVVLEACLSGRLSHIPRRPHDRERARLITSGNVFIYEENASGIKRWTDGMTWSPSRIMGNFLLYRELNPNHYTTGEKKVARKRRRPEGDKTRDPAAPSSSRDAAITEEDRHLVGSLVDSYGFKENGLVKKTLTVQYHNVVHHIIAYYNTNDIKEGKFVRPMFTNELKDVVPRQELVQGNFKAPVHETEDAMSQSAPSPSAPIDSRYMDLHSRFTPPRSGLHRSSASLHSLGGDERYTPSPHPQDLMEFTQDPVAYSHAINKTYEQHHSRSRRSNTFTSASRIASPMGDDPSSSFTRAHPPQTITSVKARRQATSEAAHLNLELNTSFPNNWIPAAEGSGHSSKRLRAEAQSMVAMNSALNHGPLTAPPLTNAMNDPSFNVYQDPQGWYGAMFPMPQPSADQLAMMRTRSNYSPHLNMAGPSYFAALTSPTIPQMSSEVRPENLPAYLPAYHINPTTGTSQNDPNIYTTTTRA